MAKTIEVNHTGKSGEMLKIVLVNFLLNVVTLTFYRFWGKTKVRRYLWRHTVLDGTPLEYTGTGLELFLGFLVAAGIFFVVTLVGQFTLGQSAEPALIGLYNLAFFIFIILFTGFAVYRARNYRLSRTNWRGIRGAMSGSAWRHALRWMSYYILLGLSMGLAYPWVRTRLQKPLTRQSQFGGNNFDLTANAKPLYKPFLVCFGASFFALLAAFTVAGILIIVLGFGAKYFDLADGGSYKEIMSGIGFIVGIAIVLFMYIAVAAIYSCYFVFEMRHFIRHTKYASLDLNLEAKAGALIRLSIGNFSFLY